MYFDSGVPNRRSYSDTAVASGCAIYVRQNDAERYWYSVSSTPVSRRGCSSGQQLSTQFSKLPATRRTRAMIVWRGEPLSTRQVGCAGTTSVVGDTPSRHDGTPSQESEKIWMRLTFQCLGFRLSLARLSRQQDPLSFRRGKKKQAVSSGSFHQSLNAEPWLNELTPRP